MYFIGYSAIGYLLIELLPTGFLTSLLSGHSPASIALAATLGVPVYITTEASLPMVAALVHGGLGLGPAMAFLVTGAGTSIGALTGAFVIARTGRRNARTGIGISRIGAGGSAKDWDIVHWFHAAFRARPWSRGGGDLRLWSSPNGGRTVA